MSDFTHIALGTGHYVITGGLYDGIPAIYFEPVAVPGPVGGLAPDGPMDEVNPGTVILTFSDPKAASVIINAAKRIVRSGEAVAALHG
jgi:hypothetical protein